MVKKVIIILTITLMLFNIGSGCFALEISSADLVKVGTAGEHLKYYREDRGYSTYIVCSVVGYHDSNGNFFPAYCMNKDLPGAETQEYTVDINSLINNDAVWRVVTNGFPYKSANEMGLEYDFDAYCVTKMAIYCVLGQSELLYYSADSSDSIGQQMLSILNNLVNIGLNGTETKASGTMSITQSGDLVAIGDHYYQEYSVSSTVNMSSFDVNVENFPEGTYICGTDNNPKTSFSSGENFRVFIPKSSFSSNISGKVTVIGKCETYPVFYGEGPDGYQNYAITYTSYGDEQTSIDFSVSTNTGSLKIYKVDDETNVAIEGVTFKLASEDGVYQYEGTTDSNGELYLGNLYQGNYILTEISTNEKYELNSSENIISITYNSESQITIGNSIKRGGVKIVKIDSETEEALEGVKFNIVDSDTEEIIETLITDENGEAVSSDLRVDRNYYVQEIESLENYILNDEPIYFTVSPDETLEIIVQNNVKKGNVKILKIDSETEEALEGVKFNIIDGDTEEVVETLITDENGEAVSSDLRVDRNYYIQEIETLENYVLNEETIGFIVQANETLELTISNDIQKGKIKITKIDYETGEALQGVKFNIIDSDTGEIIETLITDENGEAVSSDLRVDGNYYLQEVETLDDYILNEDIWYFTVLNGDVFEIIIENKKVEEEILKVAEVEETKILPKTGF